MILWERAGLGLVLGFAASVLNLGALWMGIRLFANEITASATPTKNAPLIVLACFMKMPLFIIAGFGAWRIGAPAPAYFLAGLTLVYFPMIWWALRAC